MLLNLFTMSAVGGTLEGRVDMALDRAPTAFAVLHWILGLIVMLVTSGVARRAAKSRRTF